MAKRKQQAANSEHVYEWLHVEPEPIVYMTPYEVDGARLPYTERMLARREAVTCTTVVNVKSAAYDVYIGRPKPGKTSEGWGNPFRIGKDGTREEVINKYREWLQSQPELLARIPELRGKRLGCWCKPEACHGDILAELANG